MKYTEFKETEILVKKEVEKSGPGIFEIIGNFFSEVGPIIFDQGKLRWYQIGRLMKLGKATIEFINNIKNYLQR